LEDDADGVEPLTPPPPSAQETAPSVKWPASGRTAGGRAADSPSRSCEREGEWMGVCVCV